MIENTNIRGWQGRGREIVLGAAALFGIAVAILWSWNTLAVDLFGAPEFAFRHAVAATIGVLVVGFVSGRRDRGRAQ
jgi:hypothetical protein